MGTHVAVVLDLRLVVLNGLQSSVDGLGNVGLAKRGHATKPSIGLKRHDTLGKRKKEERKQQC